VAESIPTITVLAGTNGAGKSSIGGAQLEAAQAVFFNPDVETQALRSANPGLTQDEANAAAWRIGKERLVAAIAEKRSYNFETTLGGASITALLEQAHRSGLRVRMWYCGLRDVDLHIARVRARVSRGGHDIPEVKIRERFNASRENLCTLVPSLDELLIYDNSAEADLLNGVAPQPVQILHYKNGRVLFMTNSMPDWAKPIAAVVLSQDIA
jgi:predicted ABC-type ATPase